MNHMTNAVSTGARGSNRALDDMSDAVVAISAACGSAGHVQAAADFVREGKCLTVFHLHKVTDEEDERKNPKAAVAFARRQAANCREAAAAAATAAAAGEGSEQATQLRGWAQQWQAIAEQHAKRHEESWTPEKRKVRCCCRAACAWGFNCSTLPSVFCPLFFAVFACVLSSLSVSSPLRIAIRPSFAPMHGVVPSSLRCPPLRFPWRIVLRNDRRRARKSRPALKRPLVSPPT